MSSGGSSPAPDPVPASCIACSAALEPWRTVKTQEPGSKRRYTLYRCPSCGSASTAGAGDPDLYETGVYREGKTRLAPLVEALRRSYENQRLRLLRRSTPPPAVVLDAGAGQGRFVGAARKRGYEASGFEPSRRGVEIAASRGVDLQQADFESAEIAPASVDIVTVSHVLEHLDDPAAALERVNRWLRPGGVLLLGVPNLASLQAKIGGESWLHLDVPRHRHHFTPAGLRRLLGRHGFAIESEHHLLIEHNPFGMWQSWADRLTSTPAYAYNLIKRNARLQLRDLAATLAALLLVPFAVLAEVIAALARRGGTIIVVARRQ